MVNKATFLHFRVSDRPLPESDPVKREHWFQKCAFFGRNASFSHMLLSGT